MARPLAKKKATRKTYPPEFRSEALALAEKLGVPSAARDLGLGKSQLYRWRSTARTEQSQRESEQEQTGETASLESKLAELTEELAILKKAETYFSNLSN